MPADDVPPSDLIPHEAAIAEAMASQHRWRRYGRFFLAALGSIPWVGGVIAATAALQAETEQGRVNELLKEWVSSHQRMIEELQATVAEITRRLDDLGPEAQARAESDAYLVLVRKGFKAWDSADTPHKRQLLVNLLTNAAGTSLCPDDLVRLFIEWIDHYHEAHFKVIAEIYKNRGCTRADIWANIYGARVRETSAEADLFKLLIRDLSTGSVIRQHRPTDGAGNYLPKPRKRAGPGQSGQPLKSAFDNEEPYELTQLGEQFVHYAMNDVVKRIECTTRAPEPGPAS